MKKKTELNKKLLSNIGVTQGRLVPSEKKNRIQYFQLKLEKEIGLMSKCNIHKLEWTVNFEKIK